MIVFLEHNIVFFRMPHTGTRAFSKYCIRRLKTEIKLLGLRRYHSTKAPKEYRGEDWKYAVTVRHPLHRLVSIYFDPAVQKHLKKPAFEAFVDAVLEKRYCGRWEFEMLFPNMSDFIDSIPGEITYLFRQESLSRDLSALPFIPDAFRLPRRGWRQVGEDRIPMAAFYRHDRVHKKALAWAGDDFERFGYDPKDLSEPCISPT